VEVIEQPFRCGRDKLPGSHIVSQGSIGFMQHAGVLVKPEKDVARTAPRARVHREARGERQRTCF
jgi:hypothetical protein